MQTRGVKVNIDPSLKKKTQQERHEEREQKVAEAQAEKERKATQVAAQHKRRQEAQARIAAIEDLQVENTSNLLALRPDQVEDSAATSAHSGAARGGRGGAAHGGRGGTARGGRGGATRGGRGGAARGGRGGAARGGRGGASRGDYSGRGGGHGGDESRGSVDHHDITTDEVAEAEDTLLQVANDDDAAAVNSDIEMPPVTEVDTESEGAIDVSTDQPDEADPESIGSAIVEFSEDDDDYVEEGEAEDDDEEQPEPRKRQLKTKEDRQSIRQGITSARMVKPKPPVQPLTTAPGKRRASGTNNEQSKKRPNTGCKPNYSTLI
ncbi:hypothetical protein VKT23_010163 [Stygiomarasmius scandens]|uniref:Uncharacterized protein n=1 Tax=Marasmiellus scandens TaxID=2682957 RepID=A0ABR1JC78_9AGAR